MAYIDGAGHCSLGCLTHTQKVLGVNLNSHYSYIYFRLLRIKIPAEWNSTVMYTLTHGCPLSKRWWAVSERGRTGPSTLSPTSCTSRTSSWASLRQRRRRQTRQRWPLMVLYEGGFQIVPQGALCVNLFSFKEHNLCLHQPYHTTCWWKLFSASTLWYIFAVLLNWMQTNLFYTLK